MLKNPSTYAALLTWGATGFMSQPTMASAVVHLILSPLLLVATVLLAQHEGKSAA